MTAKKKEKFDKASATSKVRLERIKKYMKIVDGKEVTYLLETDG